MDSRNVALTGGVAGIHETTSPPDETTMTTMTDDTDDEYDPNLNSYKEYRERIELMVDGIEDELHHYEDKDTYDRHDALVEAVFETVDSSRMVIYTHEAINVLKHSDKQPDEWQPFADDGSTWQKVITAMAFSIVRQDVWEEIRRRGLDE